MYPMYLLNQSNNNVGNADANNTNNNIYEVPTKFASLQLPHTKTLGNFFKNYKGIIPDSKYVNYSLNYLNRA